MFLIYFISLGPPSLVWVCYVLDLQYIFTNTSFFPIIEFYSLVCLSSTGSELVLVVSGKFKNKDVPRHQGHLTYCIGIVSINVIKNFCIFKKCILIICHQLKGKYI